MLKTKSGFQTIRINAASDSVLIGWLGRFIQIANMNVPTKTAARITGGRPPVIAVYRKQTARIQIILAVGGRRSSAAVQLASTTMIAKCKPLTESRCAVPVTNNRSRGVGGRQNRAVR